MKTKHRLNSPDNHAASWLGSWIRIVAVVVLSASASVADDIPDPSSGRFGGLYKVVSSTDPIFPATPTSEYFLDFGRGIQADKLSGSVAVSLRRNPNVKVRIMAWQYFPAQGKIVLGNPFAEGSRNAVAKGVWQMKGVSKGVVFVRGDYQIVLHPAGPDDY
jgi:hypothetical protein